ncbi:UNVERIFIED_CONTAM: hypothetical protein RF653_18555 [Kocuria sp. CPCC 205316]|uniref:hypothetical protein n=1 Tax=Kocuria TaxID=57493 RepID=UPI0036DAFEAE
MSSFARVVRGGLAGALSASLAAASHFAVDKAAPEPVVVVAAVAAAVGVCVLLAGHRMGPVRLGSAVAISQGAYHLLFSLPGGNTVGAAAHFPRGGEPAHGHTHAPLGTVPPDPFPVETAHDPMLVLHLLATVVTYLLLRHGEQAWWALVDVLGTPIRRLLTVALPWVAARRPLGRPDRSFHYALHDLGCALEIVTPRGPPVAVL